MELIFIPMKPKNAMLQSDPSIVFQSDSFIDSYDERLGSKGKNDGWIDVGKKFLRIGSAQEEI